MKRRGEGGVGQAECCCTAASCEAGTAQCTFALLGTLCRDDTMLKQAAGRQKAAPVFHLWAARHTLLLGTVHFGEKQSGVCRGYRRAADQRHVLAGLLPSAEKTLYSSLLSTSAGTAVSGTRVPHFPPPPPSRLMLARDTGTATRHCSSQAEHTLYIIIL